MILLRADEGIIKVGKFYVNKCAGSPEHRHTHYAHCHSCIQHCFKFLTSNTYYFGLAWLDRRLEKLPSGNRTGEKP